MEIVIGLGAREHFGAGTLRRAAAGFSRSTGDAKTVALDLTGISGLGVGADHAVEAAIEGFWGARYRYTRYHAGDPDPLESLTVVVATGEVSAAERGLERGRTIADATRLARDLANEPAGALTPSQLAEVAVEVAERAGLEATILDEEAIVGASLGGLLGVAAGSVQPPRLIKLVYEPADGDARRSADGSVPTVAFVGKGITFDSGGLSLKTADGMMTMKTDMSGAAVVIAALGACRALGVGVRVIGLAPTTENMPGGRPPSPGTCSRSATARPSRYSTPMPRAASCSPTASRSRPRSGQMRSSTSRPSPERASSRSDASIAGLMGNDDRLISAVQAASERAGEATWWLPLPDEYRSDIDSEVADMKNIGKPGSGGALVAALLLKEFVGDRPWVHLDIAGPSRSEEDSGEFRKGATGFGVRTLLELLDGYEPLESPAQGSAGRKVIP